MQLLFGVLFAGLIAVGCASITGPYLLWGLDKVFELHPKALAEPNEYKVVQLLQEAAAVVIFVRNGTAKRLDGSSLPKFQRLVKRNIWAYLPQQSFVVEVSDYNSNIEVINLSGIPDVDDAQMVSGFNDAVTIFGDGKVLGIIASREEDAHSLAKRETNENEDDLHTTTMQTPLSDETEESFIYVADGRKAILYVNSAPLLKIGGTKEIIKLVEHNKAITFDDQKAKHYGRLNIIFSVDSEKLFLRFNYTLFQQTWTMRSVELEFKDYKTVLTVKGDRYSIPSAPIGFSYRCSAYSLVFTNGNDTLSINDFQVQPWLNGNTKFGEPYDCVFSITAPIWSGLFVVSFLCFVIFVGNWIILDIKPICRFDNCRGKQLTFTVQE